MPRVAQYTAGFGPARDRTHTETTGWREPTYGVDADEG